MESRHVASIGKDILWTRIPDLRPDVAHAPTLSELVWITSAVATIIQTVLCTPADPLAGVLLAGLRETARDRYHELIQAQQTYHTQPV